MSSWQTYAIRLALPDWRPQGLVDVDGRGLPRFPRLEAVPGFYRFRLGTDAFIGQSENLRQRMALFRGWREDRQDTHPDLYKGLRTGGTVLDVIDAATLDDTPLDLTSRAAREFVEGWLRLREQPNWNRDRWPEAILGDDDIGPV